MKRPKLVLLSLAALLFGACTGGRSETTPSSTPTLTPPASGERTQASLVGTRWVLAYVDGRAWPVGDGREVTMTFRARRLGGFSGCNEYGGRWRITGKSLTVGQLVTTLIGCHGPARWVERRLFTSFRLHQG